MKKQIKSIIAVILSLLMLVSVVIPAYAGAANPTLTIDSAQAVKGSSVSTKLSISNNPGFAAATFKIVYDSSILKLESVTFNNEFGGDFDELGSLALPVSGSDALKAVQISWSSMTNISANGTFLTMHFTVNANAPKDASATVRIISNKGDFCDIDENDVVFSSVDGVVKVVEGIPGDINGDKEVNSKDLIRLRKYFTGWDVNVDILACDCNGDGNVNSKDLIRLRKYFSGWDVELFYGSSSTAVCNHNLVKTNAKAETCIEDGNIEYWTCSICKKIYADANALSEITSESTVLKAKGHTVVVDAAVEPTYDSTGLTEGSHCSTCVTVLKKQEVIPKLQKTEYSITYHISNGDEYLAQQTIQNDNYTTYTSEQGVSRFENPSVPGYQFLGWYDLPSGDAAENIKSIPAGTTGNIDLYARWKKLPYKVNFSSELIPVASETYTVDEEHVLPSPKLDGYVFVGWSDADGNVIKNIPLGTVGTKTYTANWLSERNQAWTNKKIDAPIIYEDEDTNTILFAYNIGEIRNVPVSVIHDFGKINSNGVTKTVTTEVSKSVSKTCMDTYTDTVQKATTDSFSWTLSSGWSDSVSVNEAWAKEQGLTEEEINTRYRDDNSNWYVSNGSSGSKTTSEVTGTDKTTLESSTKNKTATETDTSTQKTNVSAELKATMGSDVTGKIEAGMSASLSTEDTHLDSTVKEKSSSKGTDTTEYGRKTTDNNSSWNNESGYGGSTTIGESSTVSKALSQKLSEQYSIGKSYINTESESNTQGKSTSAASTNQYSSSVTYSTVTNEKREETYTTENTVSGYHRWVMAGTAHVFAIVGYDIATSSYFVSTYSIMDDEIYEYEDYSYLKASYDDNENSVIGFEVPYSDIADYVANRIGKSEGLEISKTGVVTSYTGTDSCVLIPEYMVIDNNDGTKSVVKVTEISSTAFSNKNIEGIIFSDFISEIPDKAFNNCKMLKSVSAVGITKIGDQAFYGCSSLGEVIIGENVTKLGRNVVDSNTKLGVVASNGNVVTAATSSGAKEITIAISDKCADLNNIALNIPNVCQYFAFYGYDNAYNNLRIVSDAKKTIINRVNLICDGQTPLLISSSDVELHETTVKSPGICLALTADKTNLALRGECELTASTGNPMLCKQISLSQIDASLTTSLTVNGNLLIATSEKDILSGKNLLKVTGKIVGITVDEFNKYLKGVFTVSFNANEGIVNESSKTVVYGSTYGSLPTPTREYYNFSGWFTEKNDGIRVTENTEVNSTEDVILYAHWEQKPTSGWVLASELPANAKAVEEKWTYDETTKITSDKSEVEGYTLYDTTSEWGEYGEWSAWSFNAVSASESRQVEKKSVHTGYYMDTYNTMSTGGARQFRSFSIDGKFSSYGCSSSYGEYHKSTTMTLSEANSVPKVAEGAYASNCSFPGYNKGNGTGYILTWEDGGTYVFFISGNVYNPNYRYRDRKLVYTYWLSKTEAKESTSEVEVSESISNVQKWVKYIEK